MQHLIHYCWHLVTWATFSLLVCVALMITHNLPVHKSFATQTAETQPDFHRLSITIERSVVLVLSLIFSMFLLCAADKAGYSLILLID